MKIAVPYENGQVFQHFGHSGQFKIYDVEDGRIAAERIAVPAGSGHGALAGFLSGLEVDTLICGGIGGGARTKLRARTLVFNPLFRIFAPKTDFRRRITIKRYTTCT